MVVPSSGHVPVRRPYSRRIPEGSGEIIESERLARRYFALFRKETLEELRAVIHPDVLLELQVVQPGRVLRGRDAVIAFLEEE
jgi:hypothetical protein